MSDNVILGVDIGGTKVAAGLVDSSGSILSSARVPMVATGTADDGVQAVRRAIDAVLPDGRGTRLTGIGIISPGTLDLEEGRVLVSPNLPCWHEFPLRDAIEQAYALPTQLDNDANAAGLAEAVWGAGKGYNSVFGVTIGTGIGTAIIFGRRIHHGRTGAAGEGGHMTIDYRGPVRCGCGKRGCIEGLVSGPSVARTARKRMQATPAAATRLREMSGNDPSRVSSEMVLAAWEEGDVFAFSLVDELTDLLAVWLGNMIDLLEPEVIVVGGGFGSALAPIFPEIRHRITKYSINLRAQEIPILPAKYGAESGIAGAAALLLQGVGIAAAR